MIDWIKYHIFNRLVLGGRSLEWSKARKLFLEDSPRCEVCGKVGTIFEPNNVHHIIPVHVDPSRELDYDNLITLCRRDHLLFGHLGSWISYNEDIQIDVKNWQTKIKNRP